MIALVPNVLVCNTNIETGFPAQAFHMFMEKFEELSAFAETSKIRKLEWNIL